MKGEAGSGAFNGGVPWVEWAPPNWALGMRCVATLSGNQVWHGMGGERVKFRPGAARPPAGRRAA